MFLNKLKTMLALLVVGVSMAVPAAQASDIDELTDMLHKFLAGSAGQAAHERFWAEDLIYTSSRGTRTNKMEIMRRFAEADNDESEEAGPVYTAEDIQIQLYGTTAVVAFRLVGTPAADGADTSVQYYLNTGTFLKRNGIWQVVAWQATIVPGP